MSTYWCKACPIKELSTEEGEPASVQGVPLEMCSLLFILLQRGLKSTFLHYNFKKLPEWRQVTGGEDTENQDFHKGLLTQTDTQAPDWKTSKMRHMSLYAQGAIACTGLPCQGLRALGSLQQQIPLTTEAVTLISHP